MRREGRLRGKPTNNICVGALCLRSVERSKHKTRERYKRLRAAAGMCINARRAEFLLREIEGFPDEFDDLVIRNEDDSGAVQLGTLAVTMCSIIEASLRGGIHGGFEEMGKEVVMACTVKGSEENWSDVELLESDRESEDWSLVDEDYDV